MRDSKGERFGGLGVQDHLKFGRQLNRQVGRLGATENAIHIGRRAAKDVHLVGSVGKQTAVFDKERILINRRYVVSGCQQYDWRAMNQHKSIPVDDEAASRL